MTFEEKILRDAGHLSFTTLLHELKYLRERNKELEGTLQDAFDVLPPTDVVLDKDQVELLDNIAALLGIERVGDEGEG